MRGVRYLILSVLLIGALGLAACSAALPAAFSLAGTLTTNRPAAAVETGLAVNSPVERPAALALAASDLEGRLTEIYNSTNPAVVNIRVLAQRTGSMGGQAPVAQGEGSGFVWDSQGHIVTNNHVVDGAQRVTVTFADGTAIPATVVGTDPESDLAVVKVNPGAVKLQPISVGDSTSVKVGQFVVAIGNPFGLEGSMSFGIVSALGRSLPASGESAVTSQGPSYTIPDIIQTDAPVNPGNSGGVLLDLAGNLIGVPSAIESPVRGSAGVGFAIPSAIVKQVVPELIQSGKFAHPWIGISGGTLSPEIAQAMGLSETQRGALVASVSKDSPADQAGLIGNARSATIDGQEVQVGGDVITAIEGQPVKRFEDLVTYLARNGKVGQTVKLTILRDGQPRALSLTLAARPTTQTTAVQPRSNRGDPGQPQTPAPRDNRSNPRATPQPSQGTAWLGVAGVDVTPEMAAAMKLNAGQTGALIQQVVPGSPADKAGLKVGTEDFDQNGRNIKLGGDVIVGADGKKMTSMQDLVKIVQGMKAGDKLNLSVLRNGSEIKVTVELAVRPAN
jgi:S1-C subfamily serine protease